MAKPAQRRKPNNTGLNLFFALGLSIALACIIVPMLLTERGHSSNAFSLSTSASAVVQQSVDQLTTAANPGARSEAARWLSTQFSREPGIVNSIGKALKNDRDPVVRATAANAIAKIARSSQDDPAAAELFANEEAGIASLLRTQYSAETNEAVRRCIINAAGELDHPEAGHLIEEALADNDPSVKEEALRAKVERERRAQLKKMG